MATCPAVDLTFRLLFEVSVSAAAESARVNYLVAIMCASHTQSTPAQHFGVTTFETCTSRVYACVCDCSECSALQY